MLSWLFVIGCYHIMVFMAGQTKIGVMRVPLSLFFIFQQRQTRVIKLSQSPLASLAKVLADKGAIKKQSAHFLSSICKTGSDLPFHVSHSIASSQIGNFSRNSAPSSPSPFKKCLLYLISFCTLSLSTIFMLYYSCISSTNFLSFIVATDPVTPISKLGLFFSGNIYFILSILLSTL